MNLNKLRLSSLISKFKKNFNDLSEKDMIIGEVLKRKKIITEEQLNHALDIQKSKLIENGQAVPLGIIITELGYAPENDLVNAVNEHYRLSVSSLSDNIRELVNTLRGTFVERLPSPRIPIWFQLAVTTILVIALTAISLNFFILNRQKEQLYNKTVKIGLISLNYFDNNARVPLLEDNLLQLNGLVKNATEVEGIAYAFITDNNNKIKAHTDLNRIGTFSQKFEHIKNITKKEKNTYFNHTLPDGRRVLNLNRSILFKKKKLGNVHVGVSIDFIEDLIERERAAIIFITLGVIIVGIAVAIFQGLRYSKPIKKLVVATHEVSNGNYRHKIKLDRNDEFGNLATAFNKMNDELWRNSLMQESFGKYVGPEVLEMIMADPQSTWLKGRRNEATILFIDIRGFTSFSDEKEPEHVVVMLNEYFEIASRTIIDYGGYIDKFMGDAVLGVFGVPVFRKNHVERALRAAMSFQEELRKPGKNVNRLFASVGIGIDTGIVVSGNIGSQAKMEYTVIGNSVNVASRLNGLAGPGETIISKNTYEHVKNIITAEALPAQRIKGRSNAIEIFRVLDIKES